MYQIKRKEQVTPHVYMFDVHAPAVAYKSNPGQFVIIRPHDHGERIPITIAGADTEEGTVRIYVAEVGASSKEICSINEGESFLNFSGPLGNALETENYGSVLIIGGAAFIGAQYYLTQAMKEAGNQVYSIITARNENEFFLVDEIEKLSHKLYLVSEDGRSQYQTFDFLQDPLKDGVFNKVVTIGPTSMQKMISETTKPYGIPTTVNLFPIMVDGTGMCGACRVTVGGSTKFACIDGPDFDGHEVNFEELISRMRYYTAQEKISMVLKDKGVI